jgi:hypothetical protein
VSLEMHLEAAIERVWRWTWRPRWSEFRDAIGSRDRATLVVRAHMPAFGLIGISMVFIGIRLQRWMRVIVDVDV